MALGGVGGTVVLVKMAGHVSPWTLWNGAAKHTGCVGEQDDGRQRRGLDVGSSVRGFIASAIARPRHSRVAFPYRHSDGRGDLLRNSD